MNAYEEGYQAVSILSNPYWPTYPKHSTPDDERNAMLFVDGWVAALIEKGTGNGN